MKKILVVFPVLLALLSFSVGNAFAAGGGGAAAAASVILLNNAKVKAEEERVNQAAAKMMANALTPDVLLAAEVLARKEIAKLEKTTERPYGADWKAASEGLRKSLQLPYGDKWYNRGDIWYYVLVKWDGKIFLSGGKYNNVDRQIGSWWNSEAK